MIARGVTVALLIASLFVSTNTVRNHISSVIRKLGVHSRLEAAALVMRKGVLEELVPV